MKTEFCWLYHREKSLFAVITLDVLRKSLSLFTFSVFSSKWYYFLLLFLLFFYSALPHVETVCSRWICFFNSSLYTENSYKIMATFFHLCFFYAVVRRDLELNVHVLFWIRMYHRRVHRTLWNLFYKLLIHFGSSGIAWHWIAPAVFIHLFSRTILYSYTWRWLWDMCGNLFCIQILFLFRS